jgi:maltooligosyltrehalose trehalohydrolase
VIYELHVGTFTAEGSLDAAAARLGHLVELGVDAVELLPVNAFNGHHNWGYDGVFWFAVHEAYGGPAAYQRFVDACHAHGIAVIQDVVYNHLGPSGNVLPRFGPYLSESDANTWGATVNLDGDGSAEVRRFILDNAHMWFADYHVDGLRLDAVHALRDGSTPHLLAELSAESEALSDAIGRPLSLIAESDLNDPVMFRPRESGGYGLTAQWSDDFHHALHVALTGETGGYYADFASLDALEKVLTRGFFHDGTWSSFRGREHGIPIDTAHTPAWRLVVSDQNHDQIGNRAAGDRLSASLSRGRLAIAAALTLLSPFTPMLFMGEEWGARTPWQFFTSHPEPDLGQRTAAGRFAEFERMGWDASVVPDPQDPATFSRSKLDWAEAERDPDGLLQLYRRLIEIRRSHPALADSSFAATRVQADDAEKFLAVRRGDLVIAVNLADRPRALPYQENGVRVLLVAGDVAADDRGVTGAAPGELAAVPGPGVVVLDRSAATQDTEDTEG